MQTLQLGSYPQWGLLMAFLLAVVAAWPKVKAIAVAREAKVLEVYGTEVDRLRTRLVAVERELATCHRECSEKCDELRLQLIGMKQQRLQEQISFFSALPHNMLSVEMIDLIEQLKAERLAQQQLDPQENKHE